jgi:hypothetical protein
MDATRPFYRLGQIRFIEPVPRADFEEFLTVKFRRGGFRVEHSDAIIRILQLAEDVPYNVQLLAHTCWYELRNQSAKDFSGPYNRNCRCRHAPNRPAIRPLLYADLVCSYSYTTEDSSRNQRSGLRLAIPKGRAIRWQRGFDRATVGGISDREGHPPRRGARRRDQASFRRSVLFTMDSRVPCKSCGSAPLLIL